jgi:hypothetical protein
MKKHILYNKSATTAFLFGFDSFKFYNISLYMLSFLSNINNTS